MIDIGYWRCQAIAFSANRRKPTVTVRPFWTVTPASQHLRAAKTDLIIPESPSDALSKCVHLAIGCATLRDGKNHIYLGSNGPDTTYMQQL